MYGKLFNNSNPKKSNSKINAISTVVLWCKSDTRHTPENLKPVTVTFYAIKDRNVLGYNEKIGPFKK